MTRLRPHTTMLVATGFLGVLILFSGTRLVNGVTRADTSIDVDDTVDEQALSERGLNETNRKSPSRSIVIANDSHDPRIREAIAKAAGYLKSKTEQERVGELSRGELTWTDGMLYPILHRLERNGYVKAIWGESETGRRRKYYQLTKAGAEHLERQRRQWHLVDLALRSSGTARNAASICAM